MSRYLVITEATATDFSAFAPDLSGCVATGATRAEAEDQMRQVVAFHIDGLTLEGYDIPEPRTAVSYAEV